VSYPLEFRYFLFFSPFVVFFGFAMKPFSNFSRYKVQLMSQNGGKKIKGGVKWREK
jgi:hypothetical protein